MEPNRKRFVVRFVSYYKLYQNSFSMGISTLPWIYCGGINVSTMDTSQRLSANHIRVGKLYNWQAESAPRVCRAHSLVLLIAILLNKP